MERAEREEEEGGGGGEGARSLAPPLARCLRASGQEGEDLSCLRVEGSGRSHAPHWTRQETKHGSSGAAGGGGRSNERASERASEGGY